MHVYIKMTSSKKINSQYGCGYVGNIENPVVGAAESKVHLYSSFTISSDFRTIGCPEAFPFASARPVDVFRGKDAEACSSVNEVASA